MAARLIGKAAMGMGRVLAAAHRPNAIFCAQFGSMALRQQPAAAEGLRGLKCWTLVPAAVQGKAQQQQQAWSRSMSSQVTLSDLRDNPGARKKKVRVGRGTGSGKGKMGGRGHKGQLSRAGNNGRLGFEGGQTPITRRYPKRGFNNAHSYLSDLQPLNLDRLVRYVDAGRLDLTKTITMKHLRDCGCVSSKIKKGVKLLARNAEQVKIEKAINIQVSDVSSKAKELIEKAGGSVQVSYFNALGLRALLKPEKFETIPRLAAPPPRLMWKYPEHYKDVEAQLRAKAGK